jgi:alkanesulfonate monooxygenase
LPDVDGQVAYWSRAEQLGIDSLLVDMNSGKPDPMTLALALARSTSRICFMVAARPGLMSPTLFVQQVNTFSVLGGGRISLNVVAGHSPLEQRSYGDHLEHDERYARMEEWLAICRALWDAHQPVSYSGRFYNINEGRLNTPFVARGRTRPEIYIGGNSVKARELAARYGDCWMRFADAPERIAEQATDLGERRVEVGVRLSIACRPNRAEALRAAQTPLASAATRMRATSEGRFVHESDAVSMRETYALGATEWLTPWLWTGAVQTMGAMAICIVGTPDDVATGLLAFKAAGVTQFILSGWPTLDEMIRFGDDVLPLVRSQEDEEPASIPPPPAQGVQA